MQLAGRWLKVASWWASWHYEYLTDWQSSMHATHWVKGSQICWQTDWRTSCLADGLTDSLTDWLIYRPKDWLTAWLTDCMPGSKAFPHVLLHAAFQSGNAASQCLQCTAQPWECSPASSPHSARNASPTAAINQQQRLSLSLARLSFFSLLYAHRHAGWGHFERVNRCRLICPGLSDIAQVMYLMWSLFSSNKRIKN